MNGLEHCMCWFILKTLKQPCNCSALDAEVLLSGGLLTCTHGTKNLFDRKCCAPALRVLIIDVRRLNR